MKCTKVNPVFGTVKRRNDMYINSIEHPENFICDNGDIGSIVKDGIERSWGDVGKVEVEAEEQE